MKIGTGHRAFVAASLVVGGVAAGALVLAHRRRDAADAAPSARPLDPTPATARGAANLAVAWWPQDLALEQHPGSDDVTLRFQTTVANLGGESAPIITGDHVAYTVRRTDRRGMPGEVVGRGSARLTAGDVHAFPPPFGSEIGAASATFGARLRAIDRLAPGTATIIGAGQPQQAVRLLAPGAGTFLVRQEIVRADGRRDAHPADDVRTSEVRLDSSGELLSTSSRYGD